MKNTKSEYITVRRSKIHGTGVYAKERIPKGTRIIEYVGEKITKTESDKRADIALENAENDKDNGAVYIFDLNKRHDIDGYVPYNTARYINHACDPNCEPDNLRGHVWIISVRDIEKGEELTYNYGYEFEGTEEHVCRCGCHNCVGFILAEEDWPKLKAYKYKKKLKR